MSQFVRAFVAVIAVCMCVSAEAVLVTPQVVNQPEGSVVNLTFTIEQQDIGFTSIDCQSDADIAVLGVDGSANWSDTGQPDLSLEQQGDPIGVTGQGSTVFSTCDSAMAGQSFELQLNLVDDAQPGEGAETAQLQVISLNCTTGTCDKTVNITLQESMPFPQVSISGGSATESSGSGAFTVNLDIPAPGNGLTVLYSVAQSSTADEGSDYSALSGSVFFSGGSTTAEIPITIVDDALPENDETIRVFLTPSDGYTVGNPGNAVFTIVNDDQATISIDPTSLTTGEDGTTDQFSVAIGAQPRDDLTFDFTSSDTGEVTVSPASITFNSDNWDLPQVVTVTGVDDPVVDGDQSVDIDVAVTTTDPFYAAETPPNVTVRNADDDMAGVMIDPTAINVSEDGGSTSISAVLDAEPTGDVRVDFASSNTDEATVEPAFLTFGPGNWDTPQTVTVTGVDDAVQDGDQPFTIATSVSSSDPAFSAIDPPDISGTNADNDMAGVLVEPTALTTNESGTSAPFSVVLQSEPRAPVTIAISNGDNTEGILDTFQLNFDANNWDVPQVVQVTGRDDDFVDGNQVYTMALSLSSSDSLYAAIDPADVTVTNVDDDMAGVMVTPTTVTVDESGLAASVDVVLDARPSDVVRVTAVSGNPAEGTVAPGQLVFGPGNWDTPQSFTVTGVDDDFDDGDQVFTVTTAVTTNDPAFAAIDPPDITVTNRDDDDMAGAEFRETPVTVAENVGTAEITINRVGAIGEAVSATFMTDDGAPGTTATAGTDYTSVTETLQWEAGDTAPRTVQIPITDDADNEGPESVVLKIEVAGDPPETVLGELVIENDFIENVIANIDPESLPPNLRETTRVILDTCPQGNNLPDFQELCTNLVVEALEGGSVDSALNQVTPEELASIGEQAMNNQRVQNINVAGRQQALAAGATGLNLDGLSLSLGGLSVTPMMVSSLLMADAPDGALNAEGGSGDDVFTDFGRWGIWVGGRIIFGDKDQTENGDGYDFETGGLTVGIDYRFTEEFIAGVAVGYAQNETDIDNDGGELDADGFTLTGYGSWYPTENIYLDASVSFGQNDYDQTRVVDYTLTMQGITTRQLIGAEYDGDQFGYTIGAGYDFERDGWVFGPTFYLEYIKTEIDAYDERLLDDGGAGFSVGWAAHIMDQEYESMIPSIGFQFSKAFSMSWGVLVPTGNVAWAREMENDGSILSGFYLGDVNRVNFNLVTDSFEEDFFRAGLGLSAIFPGNKSAYVTVDGDFGRDFLSTYYVNAGFRWEF